MYTAEQLELPDHLELTEVVAEANRLLQVDPDLDDAGDFSDRTVYFYVQKGLLPRRAGRGPGTTYPKSFVYRLLFIRLLQKQGLSLDDIRERFLFDDPDAVPEETIRSVLLGETPADLQQMPEPAALRESRETGQGQPQAKTVAPPSKSRSRRASASDRRRWLLMRRDAHAESIPDECASAAPPVDYDATDTLAAREMPEPQAERFTLRLAADTELVVRRELTPAQKRRLKRIGLLIADILDEDGR